MKRRSDRPFLNVTRTDRCTPPPQPLSARSAIRTVVHTPTKGQIFARRSHLDKGTKPSHSPSRSRSELPPQARDALPWYHKRHPYPSRHRRPSPIHCVHNYPGTLLRTRSPAAAPRPPSREPCNTNARYTNAAGPSPQPREIADRRGRRHGAAAPGAVSSGGARRSARKSRVSRLSHGCTDTWLPRLHPRTGLHCCSRSTSRPMEERRRRFRRNGGHVVSTEYV